MRGVTLEGSFKGYIRGFNKFWHKWVVQHNRQVLFGKAFLSRRSRDMPPRETFKFKTLANAFSYILKSIFMLLCCSQKLTNLNKFGAKKNNIYSNQFPNNALFINKKRNKISKSNYRKLALSMFSTNSGKNRYRFFV